MGAPKFERTPEVEEAILERLADGELLKDICKTDGMPSRMTVWKWTQEDKAFADLYARARESGLELMADEIIEISDDARNDWMEKNADDDAGWLANGENTRRSALRVDSRKWLLSRLVAKYGDKIQNEHSGSVTIVATPHDEAL